MGGVAAWVVVVLAAMVLGAATVAAGPMVDASRKAEHEALVEHIAAEGRRFGSLLPNGFSPAVLAAMRAVERHRFVPVTQAPFAYHDRALPIGLGQTISQPSLVALMTELLHVGKGARVLEVGTGSGYQAAILAALGAEVFTIEIVEPLGRSAERRLRELGYGDVRVRIGDGYKGWPDEAPFDAIIVTAGAPRVPPPLVAQLKPGARMVIPVDVEEGGQVLALVSREADGRVSRRDLLGVMFVPLTGDH
jgi:protein-L-isoaspartate(D-aspartate) O-methyltransferase